ncbi:phosphoglycerate kinase, cytosolic-like protein [Cinnamomum micranthum f. kanehirae]|uniref:Phosphoglycerate kinase n=1 Tax=Cinnamomum micranthum f. kanehirae TaxID=337451 RepID=A0A443P6C7_9MAGN|nr:phosphoglycerate kinase, cytosolic-like protein [Cinnamomum micranthum f. kanehirae]
MASATSPNSFSLFSSSSSSSSHHRPSFHVASSPRLHVGSLPFAPLHRLSFSSISIDPLLALHAASRLRAAASVARLRWRRRAFGDLTAADLKGKKVFSRADLNVPLDENQHITDDTRVRVAIPTIKHLIGNRVEKADDCIGPEVETMVAGLPEGGVLLLENVRFYKEEEKNEPEFAKKPDSLVDLYMAFQEILPDCAALHHRQATCNVALQTSAASLLYLTTYIATKLPRPSSVSQPASQDQAAS